MRSLSRAWWLVAVALCGTAGAQEPGSTPDPSDAPLPGLETGESEAPGVASPPALSGPLAGSWSWRRIGPIGAGAGSDVAAHPAMPGLYVLAGLSGQVWITLDHGGTWVAILSPLDALGELSLEEQIQLQVEARIEELTTDLEQDFDEPDPEDFFNDPDGYQEALDELELRMSELEEEIADAARVAVDEVQSELQADPWFLEHQEVLAGSRLAARPRVWFTQRGHLAVGRADGLWVTPDLGASWRRVLADQPVTALVERNGAVLLGTDDGVRVGSPDLTDWIDPDDGTEGLRIHTLVEGGGRVWAGTSEGLWVSDGGAFEVVWAGEPVLAVQLDPFWEGGLWFATARNVYRSDDLGRYPREPVGAPIAGISSLALLGEDHLLASSSDGVWESVSGGATWSPLNEGLAAAETRSIVLPQQVAPGRPLSPDAVVLLTSDEGLFRLSPGLEQATWDLSEEVERALAEFVPMHLLLDASLSREELRAHAGRRWLTAVAPQLTLEGRYQTRDRLLYRPETGTTRDLKGTWRMLARLQWTPPGRRSSTLLVASLQQGNVAVLGDSVQGVASRSTSRSSTAYRTVLVQRVTELHATRAELVGAWPEVMRGSVLEQTLHALRIAELEAHMDALTDGAVSRWRLGG